MATHIGLVLASGRSKRMGTDKSQLKWQGHALIDHMRHILEASHCETVYLNHPTDGIQDRYSEMGPLAGIEACLAQLLYTAPTSTAVLMSPRTATQSPVVSTFLTIVPVDMPLLTPELMMQLQDTAQHIGQGCYFETYPLPCVLPICEGIHQYIIHQIQHQQDVSVKKLLAHIQAKAIAPPEKHHLLNTNLPEEWDRLLRMNFEDQS